MKLSRQAFDASVLTYATEEIYPTMPQGWLAWVFAGALPIALAKVHPFLGMAGIEDSEGIELDLVDAFISSAFSAQPRVTIPLFDGMTFVAEDGKKLIERLRRNVNGRERSEIARINPSTQGG